MKHNFDWFPCQQCKVYALYWVSEPHCKNHQVFEYDCIDCSDALEQHRKNPKGVVCRQCGWSIPLWIAEYLDVKYGSKLRHTCVRCGCTYNQNMECCCP